jgi:hypothetical protein
LLPLQNGHMWYDTMCSDDPNTIIIKTDAVNQVSNLTLENGVGSVWVEAGATFPQAYVPFYYCFSTVSVPHSSLSFPYFLRFDSDARKMLRADFLIGQRPMAPRTRCFPDLHSCQLEHHHCRRGCHGRPPLIFEGGFAGVSGGFGYGYHQWER